MAFYKYLVDIITTPTFSREYKYNETLFSRYKPGFWNALNLNRICMLAARYQLNLSIINHSTHFVKLSKKGFTKKSLF